MASLDTNRGRKRAREARAAFRLDPDAPLPCLLSVIEEQARLPVVVTGGLPDRVAGACFRRDGGAVLWVNGRQWQPRQRFTLAHELGHVCCGHDGALPVETFETLDGRPTNPREVQANAFAAEFLVPRSGMERLIDAEPTLDHVVIIAAHYGVSSIVVVYRIGELGLASPRRAQQLVREVEDGLHRDRFETLGLEPLQDRLGTLGALPYISPSLAGTLLGAALGGDAAVDAGVAGAIERLL
jgi:Zn-dependent peptidase ImmA (M78 family)